MVTSVRNPDNVITPVSPLDYRSLAVEMGG
ncbi:hypothetical protein LAUMK13_02126 [Mycobacterium innocens]|uniref:Uncharacterized protein n=1 Tax=Mycobacterium innocens TaxID=2341083 RepID=A0A498PZR4_9MYCO|nr:hypothetical protein LAUMK13_02126 [Mycobacterium innocens]